MAFNAWTKLRTIESSEEYRTSTENRRKTCRRRREREAYERLHGEIDSLEGIKMIYKLAKTRNRDLGITDGKYILDKLRCHCGHCMKLGNGKEQTEKADRDF